MSGHKYTRSTNPFDEDDDVDDETFLKNSRRTYSSTQSSFGTQPSFGTQSSFDEQVQSFQEKRRQIEDRTLQSTERSIGILRDSEQIGIATGEELLRQREQLERTDQRLDEINASLRFSQKHINGIKSVFSSLKNYMSGKTDQSPPPVSSSNKPSPPKTEFEEAINTYDRYENHPVTRMRRADTVPLENQASGSKNISEKLDANLQEMCSTLSRMKGLASDLSYEIDTQNDLIDNINDKAELADSTIGKQNKDMNKILKKK